MDYATLVADKDTPGSIKYWVRHDSIPAASILARAQNAIASQLRVREMLVRLPGNLAQGASSITLPTGFLHPEWLGLVGLEKVEIDLLDQQHFESRVYDQEDGTPPEGTPTEATYDATTLYLNATCDQAYTYRLWYFGKPALLSGGNPTNFLTDRYEHLLEDYCKHYAWDDRKEWDISKAALQRALGYIATANAEYDMLKQRVRHEYYWR